jgi:multiple sugar transport system substrate-binding protein
MKKLVAVLLIALMVVPTLAFAKDKVKVRWFVGLGAGSDAAVLEPERKVAEDFNKSQDEIELVIDIVANAQAYDVLATQIAAGNAPDVVGPVGIRGRDSFRGHWLDLQPLVNKFKYDLSDFDPSLVDFYRIKEEGLLGLPFGIFPSFLYVNKDLFDEAGLKYPPQKFGEKYEGKEWNMDTLKELAMKLTVDKNGKDATAKDFDPENIVQFGFGMQFTDARGYGTFFGPGSLVDEKGKAQIPAVWKEAWKWFYDGMWKSHFHPNGPKGQSDYMGQGNWFNTGHIAMDDVHLWYAGCCMNDLKANWDLAVVPTYKGKTTAKLHADTFEITKASKNPDAAFKVLTYLIGPADEALLQIYGGMPARKSLQDNFFKNFNEKKFPGKTINWQVVKDSLKYSDNPNHESWMPSFQETTNKYNEFWAKIQNDPKLDVDAAMNQLQADLQKIFDAAKK